VLIYRNAEGLHGQRKFGNPCFRTQTLNYPKQCFPINGPWGGFQERHTASGKSIYNMNCIWKTT